MPWLWKLRYYTFYTVLKCFFKPALRSNNYVKITKFAPTLPFNFGQERYPFKKLLICNSNWTEWSTIQGVIARVISKSDERQARGRFEITSTITP